MTQKRLGSSHRTIGLFCILLISILIFAISGVSAEGPAFLNSTEGLKYVKAEIVTSHNDFLISNDREFKIGVLFQIEEGWHIYWKNPGEAGQPTEIDWVLPQGWKVGELKWPYPIREIERGNITTFAYKEELLLFSTLDAPPVVPNMDEEVSIEATVSFLVCKDRCVPGRMSLQKYFTVSSTKAESGPVSAKIFAKYRDLIPEDGSKIDGVSFHKTGRDRFLSFKTPVSAQFFELDGIRLKTPEISADGKVLKLSHLEADDSEPLAGVLVFKDSGKVRAFDIGSIDDWQVADKEIAKSENFRPSSFLLESQEAEELQAKVVKEDKTADLGLLFALLLSFVGGLILNVMPCVLPILAMKVFSISKGKDKTRQQNKADAFWFSAGILLTFSVLAIIAIFLRQTGASLGWGFQFQYPGFVFGLIVVLFILSLGFFDLYIADLPFLGKLATYADNNVTHSRGKNIFDGILITLLSTPCTAPFLGTALVYAFTRSPMEIFLVFIFIGLGLLAPFVLVVNSPSLLKFFPKPGAWMQTIKEVLGLGLLATIIWLLQVASMGAKLDVVSVVGELLIVFVIFWGLARLVNRSALTRIIFVSICAYLAYSFWPLGSEVKEDLNWQAYSKTLVEETEGPVFLDFTAEWCITCKYNENFVLSSKEVVELFNQNGVSLIKADWTSGSEEITKALEQYGGAGVPHYVYIPKKGADAVVLPTLLNVGVLKAAL